VELTRRGARLLLIVRNRQRAADCEREFGGDIRAFVADLSSLNEIRNVAEEILSHAPRIDVLINNAGVVSRRRTTTVDGFETTFAVNHLAYYLLTRLLLDRLKHSGPARIVNVASDAHRSYTLDFDDLQNQRQYRIFAAYGKSKLANIMFTYELARRLEGSAVTANALHPGWVATRLGLDDGLLSGVVGAVSRVFARPPARGAETGIWLASSPEVEGITGKYFVDCRERTTNPASLDRESQRRLWEISAKMVGLQP
jgi:NAD(P)-dependent dehydrogenase (short-subunit alcohol dehydrogenase family)